MRSTSPIGRGRIASAMRSIVRCNSGEGLRSIDEPEPLTRRYAPTSPDGRGGIASGVRAFQISQTP